MKKITIQDARTAINKVAKNQQTNSFLDSLTDDELGEKNLEKDFYWILGKARVIEQISKDKHVYLPYELYKVLPNGNVKSIIDTINLYIQEEEKLGIDIDE